MEDGRVINQLQNCIIVQKANWGGGDDLDTWQMTKRKEFCYDVSGVFEGYLRFLLISAVNFYYIINKLIILIPGSQ
jgi:hypothetical protein